MSTTKALWPPRRSATALSVTRRPLAMIATRVADLLHLAQNMTGDEDRLACGCQSAQEITHLDDAGGIESIRGLVEDH
jgi:hypothetical protein